jgi:hypothetical protein
MNCADAPYDVGAGSTRVISKTTSPDGTLWSRAEIAATPDWRDAGGDEFVELTATRAQTTNGINAMVFNRRP